MPFMTNGKRDYKKELSWEKKSGKSRQNDRVLRNKARREMGLEVGDPRVVDHKKALDSGGTGSRSNLKVVSRKANASKEVKRKRSKPGNN